MKKYYMNIIKIFIVVSFLVGSVMVGWYSRGFFYDIKDGKFVSMWYISTLESFHSGNIEKGINDLELLLDGEIYTLVKRKKFCSGKTSLEINRIFSNFSQYRVKNTRGYHEWPYLIENVETVDYVQRINLNRKEINETIRRVIKEYSPE